MRKVQNNILYLLIICMIFAATSTNVFAHTTYSIPSNNSKIKVVPKNNEADIQVNSGLTTFYIYVKGNDNAYISKSKSIKSVKWCGYKKIKDKNYGKYKITIKKCTKKISCKTGTLTLANGDNTIKLNITNFYGCGY